MRPHGFATFARPGGGKIQPAKKASARAVKDRKMKIDVASARARAGSRYPKPFDGPCKNKTRRRLGLAAGLTQFGVNLLELGPGAWSSQRHWHAHEDEFVYIVRGPVVLVTDAGETLLETGDCAGFKAGDRDGHHLQNGAETTALILKVGTRHPGEPHAEYSDIDLRVTGQGYVHKDDTPYSQ
jgi:uncharacterized cupin superfamily protein